MSKLYLEGNGIIKHNGKPIRQYEYAYNDEIIFEFIPFVNSEQQFIPYAISISIVDGEIIKPCNNIIITQWGDDYELQFIEQMIDVYLPPTAITQKAIYTPQGDIVVTIYQDSKTRINIEAPDIFFIHTPPKDLENAEIKMNQMGNKVIVVVTGKCQDSNYINILLIAHNCRILFEDIASKITYNKNSIEISKAFNDMKGRIVDKNLTFNGSKYEVTNRTYKCTYDHKLKPILIPYALVEALMANDIEDARSYLDNSLDATALLEFFGEIVEVTQPKYSIYDEDCVAIITSQGEYRKATIYKFEITNDKIHNIIECD